MAAIAGFRIQQRCTQQLFRELTVRVLRGRDVRAFAVIADFAVRRDYEHRAGRYAHQHQLMEARQVFRLDREGERRIVNQMYAREHIRRAGKVFVLTDDVRIVRRVRAEGGEFRAGKKQHREYVVRRGNRRAVRPLHAAGDIEGINHVAVFILVRIRAADGFVDSIMAVGEHRDGGIAVNQFTHIHIRRVVAPAIGKEIAAHLRQRADGDFLLLLFGIADACQQNQRK